MPNFLELGDAVFDAGELPRLLDLRGLDPNAALVEGKGCQCRAAFGGDNRKDQPQKCPSRASTMLSMKLYKDDKESK